MSRLHQRMPHRLWAKLRVQVFLRDGYRCVLCGRAGRLEADHVVALHLGGEKLDPDNLQTVCRNCHIEKTRRENTRTPTPGRAAWRRLVEDLADE